MLLEKAMKRLERAEALDEPAGKVVKVVGPAVSPRPVKNFLSGVCGSATGSTRCWCRCRSGSGAAPCCST